MCWAVDGARLLISCIQVDYYTITPALPEYIFEKCEYFKISVADGSACNWKHCASTCKAHKQPQDSSTSPLPPLNDTMVSRHAVHHAAGVVVVEVLS